MEVPGNSTIQAKKDDDGESEEDGGSNLGSISSVISLSEHCNALRVPTVSARELKRCSKIDPSLKQF